MYQTATIAIIEHGRLDNCYPGLGLGLEYHVNISRYTLRDHYNHAQKHDQYVDSTLVVYEFVYSSCRSVGRISSASMLIPKSEADQFSVRYEENRLNTTSISIMILGVPEVAPVDEDPTIREG
jgi:hypothetical protein